MSSVLSPVGPQPARVYWLRRVLVLGIPLILIIVIAVSCSGGGGKPSAGSGGPQTTPTDTSGTTNDCLASDLSAAINTSTDTYDVGQSALFTGVLTNVGTSACRLTTSPSTEIWTVTSGADRVWTTGPSAGCPQSTVATTKVLEAGASRQISISWDGKRLLPGCTAGDPAANGTYHLSAKLDGVHAEQVTFHIVTNNA